METIIETTWSENVQAFRKAHGDQTYHLVFGGDEILVARIPSNDGFGSELLSNLHDRDSGNEDNQEYDAAIDAIESLILGYVAAGGNPLQQEFSSGVQMAIETVSNNFL
jgi:hypothetical protein